MKVPVVLASFLFAAAMASPYGRNMKTFVDDVAELTGTTPSTVVIVAVVFCVVVIVGCLVELVAWIWCCKTCCRPEDPGQTTVLVKPVCPDPEKPRSTTPPRPRRIAPPRPPPPTTTTTEPPTQRAIDVD